MQQVSRTAHPGISYKSAQDRPGPARAVGLMGLRRAVPTHNTHGGRNLKYFIKQDAQGKPVSFFVPGNPHDWYWAMDGFVAHHNLWITLALHPPGHTPGAPGDEF